MPPSEHSEQARLVKILRRTDIRFCSVPNGARVTVREAVKLKREGLTRGVPDILIFDPPPVDPGSLTPRGQLVYQALMALPEPERLQVARAAGVAPGVAPEMKRVDGGSGASAAQIKWGRALRELGWEWEPLAGWRRAVAWLEGLGYDLTPTRPAATATSTRTRTRK